MQPLADLSTPPGAASGEAVAKPWGPLATE